MYSEYFRKEDSYEKNRLGNCSFALRNCFGALLRRYRVGRAMCWDDRVDPFRSWLFGESELICQKGAAVFSAGRFKVQCLERIDGMHPGRTFCTMPGAFCLFCKQCSAYTMRHTFFKKNLKKPLTNHKKGGIIVLVT